MLSERSQCLICRASSRLLFSDSATVSAPSAAPTTPTPSPSAAASSSPAPSSSSRVVASPLAKKLAREAGLDLGTVLQRLGQGGSGPNGRLIAEDVLKAAGRYSCRDAWRIFGQRMNEPHVFFFPQRCPPRFPPCSPPSKVGAAQ